MAHNDGVALPCSNNDGAVVTHIGDPVDVASASSMPNVSVGITLLTLLKGVGTLLALLQAAFFVYFVVNSIFHGYMLTWWYQVMITGYLPVLTVALFIEGSVLKVVVNFVTPAVATLSAVINVAIVILVSQNGDLLDDPELTMAEMYVGNWIIHTLDVIIIWGALFAAGLLVLMRALIGTMWRDELQTAGQRAIYVAFFVGSPMVLPLIYVSIWPVSKHYPTDIPDPLLWLILIGLNMVIAFFLLLCVTLTDRVVVQVPKITSFTAWASRLSCCVCHSDARQVPQSASVPAGYESVRSIVYV